MSAILIATALLANDATWPLSAEDAAKYHPAQVHFAERINATRARHGLPPCKVDPQLMEGCRRWSKYMCDTGRFHHARGHVEIIAYSGGSRRNWPGVGIGMWLGSRGHRRIMLGGYTRMGCAVWRRGGTYYYTARFR